MPLDFSPITFHSYELGQAFGFMTPKEIFALRVLAWSLPNNPVIVNIGAGAGTSGLAFAESRPDAMVYTVDISEGGPLGGMQNEANAFEGKAGLTMPAHILGDSKEIGRRWATCKSSLLPKPCPVDLCFIDGDHSYAGCRGDIEAWIGNVKPGGIVVFHDYERDVWPQVRQAVDEAAEAGVYLPILHVDTLYAARVP